MHDVITVVVSVVLSLGGGAGILQLATLRQQKRQLGSTARKTNAEGDSTMADALAVAVGPFKASILEAQSSAEKANKRADRAERRLARLEQFVEGPDRLWHQDAVREIDRLGGHIAPPPVLAPLET